MKIETKSLVKIGIAVFLVYLGIYYWPSVSKVLITLFEAAVPLIIGCIVAYIVNLVMSLYERIYFPKSTKAVVVKSRRIVCLLAAIISLLAVITIVIILVIPQLTSCITLLFAKLPVALSDLVVHIEELEILPENVMANLLSIDWNSTISQVVGALTSGFTNIVGMVVDVVSSVVGGFFTAFLSIMFSVYLLISKETLGRQGKKALSKLIKPAHYNKFEYVSGIVNKTFRGYIVGQCTEALILGMLCGLGMWILRMPYAAMISALVAFTSLVPIAGPYVGGAIAAFMIFTVSPIQAVIFVVYLVILQQIEGNLIYPKVVGTSVGLPAIWVLVAITIGGGIAGIAGMLLGVPVAAVIYKLIKDKWADEEPAAEE